MNLNFGEFLVNNPKTLGNFRRREEHLITIKGVVE